MLNFRLNQLITNYYLHNAMFFTTEQVKNQTLAQLLLLKKVVCLTYTGHKILSEHKK